MSWIYQLSLLAGMWRIYWLNALESIAQSPIRLISPDGSAQGEGLTTQVIVIDSASSDNSVAMIREKFPWVHLTACDENIGFVRGNNLGLQQTTG